MDNYDHKKIESKWQNIWAKNKLFEAVDFATSRQARGRGKKQYILVEFPYPSGEGLHTGHCRSYTALDIISRKRRMEGFNVLYPIGWDAFGLPTENYAIKTGIHPAVATKKNTDNFRRQLKSLGFSFDWSREINTTDPKYYKWTQWIFLQLYKKGLAYKAKMPINFCSACKIGLANEEVIKGKCERCGAVVTKKEIEQWMLKITKYADRLIDDLDKVDYQEKIKKQQINWIGRSEGTEIIFNVILTPPKAGEESLDPSATPQDDNYVLKVFTTRPDTLFGATYMVLSPEHELIGKLESRIENYGDVKSYIEKARQKSDIERTNEEKEKTGVELQGIKAVNPANNKEIPIFVADYVLSSYGTGAIMAVPAHDQRDFEFAKKFKLPVVKVRFPKDAIKKMISWLEKRKLGKKSVNYKLRDWIFSRQHYWGEPIPMVFCTTCKKRIGNLKSKIPNPKQIQNLKFKTQNHEYNLGEIINPGWIAIKKKDLPVELPMVEKYQPTKTGESPLANIKNWVNTKCPKCGGPAKRETDTMPNWAGSSWYYLAYVMRGNPKFKILNPKHFWDKRRIKYWMPVDLYNGGMEHTTLHLLYSRFWYKFLFDIGAVPTDEPYKRRTSHGFVLGEGGVKMSKSKDNVINPDDIVNQYGADALRLYEMFLGPFGERVAWDTKGILGVKRFLDKAWQLFVCHSDPERSEGEESQGKLREESSGDPSSATQDDKKLPRELLVKLNQTIKKVSDDIENFGFNTAVSAMMKFINHALSEKVNPKEIEHFCVILSPFAPHLSEEIWQKLGHKDSIIKEKWPKADKRYLIDKEMTIVVQVNGKLRDLIKTKTGVAEKEAIELAKNAPNAKKFIGRNKIKKEIYIKDKLINFVV